MFEDVVEGLQFSITTLRLAFTPTHRHHLRLIVSDDLVIRIVDTLGSVWTLIDNLGCFRSHGSDDLDIEYDLDSALTRGTIESINSDIADAGIAQIVVL